MRGPAASCFPGSSTPDERQIREAAAQEERNRLARELHDAVKQQIFAIQTSAATAAARFAADPAGAQQAISQVRQYIDPGVSRQTVQARVSADDLTSRELDVLRQLALGRSNKEIAVALEIGEQTVKTHVGTCSASCRSRTALRRSCRR